MALRLPKSLLLLVVHHLLDLALRFIVQIRHRSAGVDLAHADLLFALQQRLPPPLLHLFQANLQQVPKQIELQRSASDCTVEGLEQLKYVDLAGGVERPNALLLVDIPRQLAVHERHPLTSVGQVFDLETASTNIHLHVATPTHVRRNLRNEIHVHA